MALLSRQLLDRWSRLWVRLAGLGPLGRCAARLAVLPVPPYKGRARLARMDRRGFIAPGAVISHPGLRLGANVFIGERVVIYQAPDGGPVALGDRVHLHQETIIEVGAGGSVQIGPDTHIQPRCQISSYGRAITIGSNVQVAPACAFFPYDHATSPGLPLRQQPLVSRGAIVVEDDVWLGYGVVVLSGVRLGTGAVIGAGSVVTRDIPAGAVALGIPARVTSFRADPPAQR